MATIYEKLEAQTALQPLDKMGSVMVLSATTNSEYLTKVWLETLLEKHSKNFILKLERKKHEIFMIFR
ncbi:MAG: hypothetical protein U5M51_00425 [Emticicia sp.]|nr:hypothetical protein [Emticicia sp.]